MRPRRCFSIPFYHLFISVPPVRRNPGATLFANFSPDPSLFHARQKASQEYEADFFTDESHVLILLSAMERCERRWGWHFFFFFHHDQFVDPPRFRSRRNTRRLCRDSIKAIIEKFKYRSGGWIFGSSFVIICTTTKSYSLEMEIKSKNRNRWG